MNAEAKPGTVKDRHGRPCPRARRTSYPLSATCATCNEPIVAVDGGAPWAHADGRPACRLTIHHVEAAYAAWRRHAAEPTSTTASRLAAYGRASDLHREFRAQREAERHAARAAR